MGEQYRSRTAPTGFATNNHEEVLELHDDPSIGFCYDRCGHDTSGDGEEGRFAVQK